VIPDVEVERVRESADIVAVIGEFVELKRAGTDYRGPCPFHQGTHRNFSVSPRKKIYYCFVCHEGGDVFTFLQKRLGVDWPGAVRMVAEKSGIELHEVTGARQDGPDPRLPLWEANAAAAQYFQRVLWEDESARPAREYLAERGVDRELADRFELGFSPREIGLMRAHLNTLGIDDARQLEAGLLVRRDADEEPRPRFRHRLMFPILDTTSRHVGFGGRVIGTGEPKYLNSAESAVFAKGHLLYNLQQAKLAIRRDDRLYIVEGYFDVIRLVAAGIDSVVAPLGTALTEDQAGLVTRYTKNVFLLYDSDKAGEKATFRAGDSLLRRGCSVRVVSLPAGDDPDTFVRKHGAEELAKAADASIDVFDRKVQILQRGGWFADLHRRRRAIDYLLPTIRACSDALLRGMYISRAAEVSGVDPRVLETEAGALGESPRGRQYTGEPQREAPVQPERSAPRPARPRASRPPERVTGEGFSAERELIRAMLKQRSLVERLTERVGPDSFQEPRYREIFATLLQPGPESSVQDLAAVMSPPAVEMMQSLLGEPDAIQDLDRTVEHSLARLDERQLARRNREIDRLIRMAAAGEKDQLMQEKESNGREIARLREVRERQ
jgi:DNA primase